MVDEPPIDELPIEERAAEDQARRERAERRRSSIEAGRRIGGTAGAAMAGAMLALRDIYEGPPRDDIVAVSESPDEPTDIDADGIDVTVGETTVRSRPPAP